MSDPAVRITIEDLATGDKEVQEVSDNNYWIITTGECHVAHEQVYPHNGTHVLTIKGQQGK